MDLQEKIDSRLIQIEADILTYSAYMNNPATSEDDRKVVSFKVLFDMMAFTALQEFSNYVPSPTTSFMMAAGLKGATGYVSVKDNQVVISPEYKTLLSQRDEYLKNTKKN